MTDKLDAVQHIVATQHIEWIKKAHQLYQLAGGKPIDAVREIVGLCLKSAAMLTAQAASGTPPEKFGELAKEAYLAVRKDMVDVEQLLSKVKEQLRGKFGENEKIPAEAIKQALLNAGVQVEDVSVDGDVTSITIKKERNTKEDILNEFGRDVEAPKRVLN